MGVAELGGPSRRSLCVEVDGLDFSRQDLGNLHRDDLGHHFRVVHAHHMRLDQKVKCKLMQILGNLGKEESSLSTKAPVSGFSGKVPSRRELAEQARAGPRCGGTGFAPRPSPPR